MDLEVASKARGLIFDIDGTLIDTMPIHFRAWQLVAKNYGFRYSEDMLYKYAGFPTTEIVLDFSREQKIDLNIEEVVKAKNDAYLSLSNGLKPIEPVLRLVEQYYGKLPMALGTGEYRDIAWNNIKIAGIDRYFKVVVTADDVVKPKPDPETFLKCAAEMNIPAEYCQVFEDGELGLEAARRAGMIATDVRRCLKKMGNM
ncbi:MAG: HAD family hydrolase [Bacillota bacterium]